MTRMVFVIVFGVVAGATLGIALAGPTGGTFGIVFGTLFAMLWLAAEKSTRALPVGAPVFHESHRLLCVATGQFADVQLAHDGRHWCDVERCSLCSPDDQVECRKRCLDLMNDNHPPGSAHG